MRSPGSQSLEVEGFKGRIQVPLRLSGALGIDSQLFSKLDAAWGWRMRVGGRVNKLVERLPRPDDPGFLTDCSTLAVQRSAVQQHRAEAEAEAEEGRTRSFDVGPAPI